MKTNLLRTFVLSCVLSLVSCFSLKAQYVPIPDAFFRSWLSSHGYSSCMSGTLLDTTCPLLLVDTVFNYSDDRFVNMDGIQYFKNLNYLGIMSSYLASVPQVPNQLQYLYLSNDQFGPPGPDNNLASLPPLPPTLKRLTCNNSQITSLPPLPATLTYLSVLHNKITSLPSLPPSLTALLCDFNLLTSLPPLPNSLQYLYCSNNQLPSLPSLPASVIGLSCNNNLLTALPALPDSLFYCYIMDNPISCLPRISHIEYFDFTNTGINCLPNYIDIGVSSNPSLNTLPLCNLFNSNGCDIFWNISGKAYFDADANCNDSADAGLVNIPVKLWKDGVLVEQVSTLTLGGYAFDTDSFATYTISIDASTVPFQVTCPANHVDTAVVTALDSLITDKDFAMECKPGFDLAAWSIVGRFRPGSIRVVNIHAGDLNNFYGSHCAVGISGTVTVAISGPGHYVSPAPGALTPCIVTDSVLTYCISDYGNVNFNGDFNIIFQTDTTAHIGSTICFTVTVSPITGDDIQINNIQTICFPVVASCDPNNKEVYPLSAVDINGDHWLTYTINFQNTGTDTAIHIYVTDTLDADLDLSTFQLLAYSHQPMVQLKENAVRFNFPNINLVDSHANEPLSHGYVQYKIKIKDGKPIGTQINNTAFIYFDFNAPVVTNTTTNTIAIISSVADIGHPTSDIRIYPNPASNSVTISVDENMIGATAIVTDVTGRKMAAVQLVTRHLSLVTSDFANGVYFVTVTASDGRSTTKKLVVSK